MAYKNVIAASAKRGSSNVTAITKDANGNYSSGGIPQGVCVVMDAADGSFDAITIATTGQFILGVADSYPATGPGDSCIVQTLGVARIKAHSAITMGDIVKVGASDGTIATVGADGATSQYVVGIALETAAEAGDFIAVQLQPSSQEIAS